MREHASRALLNWGKQMINTPRSGPGYKQTIIITSYMHILIHQFKVFLQYLFSFYLNHSADGKHEQIITMNLLFKEWVSLGQPHVPLLIRYRVELLKIKG